MRTTTIYKHLLPEGVVIVSLTPPRNKNIPYHTGVRLQAEEGMLLTDGKRLAVCIDVETADGWNEVENPRYFIERGEML